MYNILNKYVAMLFICVYVLCIIYFIYNVIYN